MLRLNIKSLVKFNGKWFYNRHLFNGICFEVIDDVVIAMSIIKDGIWVGEYINPYINKPLGSISMIDSDALTTLNNACDENAPVIYNQEFFTGVSYDFMHGFCTGETYYIDGETEAHVDYFKTGSISYLKLHECGVAQTITWFANGGIQNYALFSRERFNVDIRHVASNKICVLCIDGDYFEDIVTLGSCLRFNFFNDKKFFSKIAGDRTLFLSGNGIDDELVGYMLQGNSFEDVEELTIWSGKVSLPVLETVLTSKRLARMIIESDSLNIQDVRWLKIHKSDVYLELNGTEIML